MQSTRWLCATKTIYCLDSPKLSYDNPTPSSHDTAYSLQIQGRWIDGSTTEALLI